MLLEDPENRIRPKIPRLLQKIIKIIEYETQAYTPAYTRFYNDIPTRLSFLTFSVLVSSKKNPEEMMLNVKRVIQTESSRQMVRCPRQLTRVCSPNTQNSYDWLSSKNLIHLFQHVHISFRRIGVNRKVERQ